MPARNARKELIKKIREDTEFIVEFWKNLEWKKEVIYFFDKEYIAVEVRGEEKHLYLRSDMFVPLVLGAGYETTPLTVLYAISSVCEKYSVVGWDKYTTKEYLVDLMDRAQNIYEELNEE
jgi:hypothetical protein